MIIVTVWCCVDIDGQKSAVFRYIADNSKCLEITWEKIADVLRDYLDKGDLAVSIIEKYCTKHIQPSVFPSLPHTRPAPTPHGDPPTSTPHGDTTSTPHGDPTPMPHGVPTSTPHGDPTPMPHGDPTSTPQGDPTSTLHDGPKSTPHGGPTSMPRGEYLLLSVMYYCGHVISNHTPHTSRVLCTTMAILVSILVVQLICCNYLYCCGVLLYS